MLRFLTAGESHGPCLTAIVEGCPAGVHDRHRRRQPRHAAPHARLRAWRTDEDRAGHGRAPLRRAVGRDARLADHARGREPRLEELGEEDVAAAGGSRPVAGGDPPASGARRPRRRPQVQPLATSATSSSARARARPRRASPSAASRRRCSRPFGILVRGWVAEIGGIVADHAGMDPEAIFSAAEVSEVRVADAERRAQDHRRASTSARSAATRSAASSRWW